jgi:hypothetical protein
MLVSADTATVSVAALIALVVSAVVSGLVKFVFDDFLAARKADRDDRLAERQANRDFEYERRKEVRALISLFDGRLMEAAADLHMRLTNLYSDPAAQRWLLAPAPPLSGYFYQSTVYRFLALFRLAVTFERQAIYFEPEIHSPEDLVFIRYAKAFQFAMSDVRLFEGADYDVSEATDHFFRDSLRGLCDMDLAPEAPLTYSYFEREVRSDPSKLPLFDFFAGLSKESTPLRWDRVVILDLLLMGFLNRVGYDDVYSQDQGAFDRTARQLTTEEVRKCAPRWIEDLRLVDEPSVEHITRALRPPETTGSRAHGQARREP